MKKRMKIALITALGACLAVSLGLFAACNKSCGDGNHVYGAWETVTAATCTAGGTEKATCTVCGEETTRNVDALGHDWKVIKDESTPATCTVDGVEKRACSRCDASETNPIEAQGHTPGEKIERLVKSANCTQDGEKVVKCEVCGEEVNVPISALGHNWVVESVVREATCTEVGLQRAHCSRGDADDAEVELPALGHDWETTYSIDTPASFGAAGSRSQHCSREGCEEKTNVTTIPQLQEDEPMQYTFRLARTNGDLITIAGVKAQVIDEGGNPLGTIAFSKGKANAALLPQNYTVRVDETTLPDGYAAAAESFSVGWANPTCTVTLRGSMLSGTPASNARYVKGSAMHNFSYTTLATNKRASETITLSGLLQEYKIVVLNFWYIDCQFCQYEFPGMQAAYENENYANDVAIIAIDPKDTVAENIRNSANGYDLGFYVTMDTAGLADRFNVSAFPTTVVIDREGIVAEVHASALVNPANYYDTPYCTQQFERLFAKYTNPPYYQDDLSTAAFILPEKRKI